MDLLSQLFSIGPFNFLIQDITRITIAFGAFVFLLCICYGYMRFLDVDSLDEYRKKEGKLKKKSNTPGVESQEESFEKAILAILSTDDEKTKSLTKLNELTNRSLPPTVKFKQMMNGLVHNPYNTTSIARVMILSMAGVGAGLFLGILLANPAALIIFAVMGFAIPIILVSLQVLRRQLVVMEGNLGLISNHLGIYKESSSLIESFKMLLTVLTPGTREYKAIHTAVIARTEAKITMDVVLRDLMVDLLADLNVKQYFDVCFIADTVSSDYKEALDYLPSRFHPIVIRNIGYVTACFYGSYI